MKIARVLWKSYRWGSVVLTTGLVLTLLTGGVMGLFSSDRVTAVTEALRNPAAVEAATPDTDVEGSRPGQVPVADQLQPGVHLWQERLQRMESSIASNVSGLGAEQERLQSRGEELRKLSVGVADLLSELLEEEVTADHALRDADQFVNIMQQRKQEHQKLPALLETLKSMEPKAVAAILTGAEGSLSEQRATELLAGLSPRKAGQVLTEMGKIDPKQAASIIARLGEAASQQEAEAPRIANNLNEAP